MFVWTWWIFNDVDNATFRPIFFNIVLLLFNDFIGVPSDPSSGGGGCITASNGEGQRSNQLKSRRLSFCGSNRTQLGQGSLFLWHADHLGTYKTLLEKCLMKSALVHDLCAIQYFHVNLVSGYLWNLFFMSSWTHRQTTKTLKKDKSAQR